MYPGGRRTAQVGRPWRHRLRSDGGLADIAPTLLQILNLEQPDAMTGRSLIEPVSNVDTAPMTARLPQPV